jgi:c-di-GMP-binding flagellar brake protein YcgR
MANLIEKYVIPGCRVDLQPISRSLSKSGEAEHVKTHQSQVLDILSEDRIEIAMPQEKSKLILLPVDGEYDLYFYGETGLYQCYARVVDRYKNKGMYVLVMDLISNLRKHQRREYYRYSCALEMNSREIKEEEELSPSDKKTEDLLPELPLKRSIVADISGGGLRFVADYAYDVGSMILCKYRLMIGGRLKEYSIKSKVLAVKELENRKGVYEHRVQYIDVDSAEREEIIKYIFDQERKTLKNQNGQ